MKGTFEAKTEKKEPFVVDLFYWAEALVFALSILVICSVFFIRFSAVNGTSMVPTLHDNDQLAVKIFGYDVPKRGDIIVVMAPDFEDEPLVKRVIGLAGDVIDIDRATGTVSINGESQYEPYIAETIMNFGDWNYPYTVPDGHVFFMGDNRNASTDSRFAMVGPLPYENIIGRVIFRLFPFSGFGKIE